MDGKKLTGLLSLGVQNTQFGKAASMAAKGLGSLVGCSGNALPTSGEQGNEIYPVGEPMCLVTGSTPIQVHLAEPMIDGQQTIRAYMPDGSLRLVDVPYLKQWNECFGGK